MFLGEKGLLFFSSVLSCLSGLIWNQATAETDVNECDKWSWKWNSATFKTDSKCYVILPVVTRWNEADDFCKAHSSYLVKIDNREVYKVVKDIFTQYMLKMHTDWRTAVCVYIGAHEDNGEWIWHDGTAVTFTEYNPSARSWKPFQNCASLRGKRYGEDPKIEIFWEKQYCFSVNCKKMCEYVIDTPPLVTSGTTEQTTELLTTKLQVQTTAKVEFKANKLLRTVMLSVPELNEKRLTYSTNWRELSYSATMCGRMCLKHNCKTFTFCATTKECFGVDFHPMPPYDAEPASGCNVWKYVII